MKHVRSTTHVEDVLAMEEVRKVLVGAPNEHEGLAGDSWHLINCMLSIAHLLTQHNVPPIMIALQRQIPTDGSSMSYLA